MTAKTFSIRISLTYALLMMGSGVQLPFLPLWLAAKGVDVAGIAAIVAGMMATRILGAPLFAWIADHFGNRRLVIQLCAGFSFVSYLLLAASDGYGPIMGMALIASFMFAPVFPLTESLGVDGSSAHGLDYGRMRLWASLSFLSGSLISGALLTQLDALTTVWLIAGAQGLSLFATLILPDEPVAEPVHGKGGQLTGARQLFFGSSFPLLMLATGLAQASHGMLYSFSSVHWSSMGFSSMAIGVFWTAGVLAEVALLAFSNALLAAFGPGRLLLIGLTGGLLRWIIMAYASSFIVIMLAQSLHALSFATAHLGTMHFIRLMVPGEFRNRAQGIYSALSGGVLLSSAAWLSGDLYRDYGAHAYLFMAGISLTGLILTLALIRFSPRVRVAAAA